jgi:L-2-hydroxyglutarate oxidase LhgO
MTKLNIIIIGSGWYGCYAALLLQKMHHITIIEKESDIFKHASFYNQNRLHLGYHYCRNYKTRKLCKKGFTKFLSTFNENMVSRIKKNYYLISNDSSVDLCFSQLFLLP